MKRFRHILFTLSMILCAVGAKAALTGQWVSHPTFDNSVTTIIPTPNRVYFMGYNQNVQPEVLAKTNTDQTLFYYDLKGDELIAANRGMNLTCGTIDKIAYNPAKGYLLIVYSNYDIDLLYDDGTVVNIPAIKHADIPGSKKINNVSFNPVLNEAWIATDFGYVIIDDDRYEVKDSRNYATKLLSAGRIGDVVIVVTDNATYTADANEPRTSLADYAKQEQYAGAGGIYHLSPTRFVAYNKDAKRFNHFRLYKVDGTEISEASNARIYGDVIVTPVKEGLIGCYGTGALKFTSGSDFYTACARPETDKDIMPAATLDLKEFFIVQPRKGLRSIDASGNITRDYMLPNAPNAYWSRGMAYHPKYGMLVNSHGYDSAFSGANVNGMAEPILLSALKDGFWTPKSPAYNAPESVDVGYNPLGLLIDPADSRYVWSGSNYSGITRLNLDDPNDILHYSFPGDPTASLPSYVETNPIQTAWNRICSFSPPKFDGNNTMWSSFYNLDDETALELRYMTDADRRASKDAASAKPWQKLRVPGLASSNLCVFLPLTSSYNKNLLLYMAQYNILVYDTNGTPAVTSDDRKGLISDKFYDQDGGEISMYRVNCAYEDPATGFVWFGTQSGAFYLQPKNILNGQKTVNRVKVARNDGTSLADYLLNGVMVTDIIADDQGRKWFATLGAGIVVTSSDGKTVIGEFTTANSDIPSDNVFNVCYNPANRSMMVSTEDGLAELFLGGSVTGEADSSEVRAYPNPVAPDYYGWVTIDGLPDNSLVKIVDSSGNLVKELGRAETGSIQWDVNNLYSKRVNTGVYYILSSPASGSGESNVGKILIMN